MRTANGITVHLSQATVEFVIALLDHGLLQGPSSERQLNPRLRSLVDAAYHVLAGGDVIIERLTPGNSEIRRSLRDLECGLCADMHTLATTHGVRKLVDII